MTAWIVFGLLAFVAVGKFADFLLGPKGQRDVKDRLADWYLRTAEEGWSGIVRSSASALDDFASHLVDRRIVSLRGALFVLLLSIGLTAILILAALPFSFGFWKFVVIDPQARVLNSLNIVALLLISASVTLPCYVATRLLLRLARTANSQALVGYSVVLEAAVAYIAIAAAISLAFPVMLANAGALVLNAFTGWPEHLHAIGVMIKAFTPRVFLDPWGEGAAMSFGNTNLAVFAASASFPAVLYIAVIGTSWLIKLTQPITKKPFLLIVDRLEASPNGVFTMLAGAAALVAGLITALFKAID